MCNAMSNSANRGVFPRFAELNVRIFLLLGTITPCIFPAGALVAVTVTRIFGSLAYVFVRAVNRLRGRAG